MRPHAAYQQPVYVRDVPLFLVAVGPVREVRQRQDVTVAAHEHPVAVRHGIARFGRVRHKLHRLHERVHLSSPLLPSVNDIGHGRDLVAARPQHLELVRTHHEVLHVAPVPRRNHHAIASQERRRYCRSQLVPHNAVGDGIQPSSTLVLTADRYGAEHGHQVCQGLAHLRFNAVTSPLVHVVAEPLAVLPSLNGRAQLVGQARKNVVDDSHQPPFARAVSHGRL